jgi:hypothetical protein
MLAKKSPRASLLCLLPVVYVMPEASLASSALLRRLSLDPKVSRSNCC